MQLTTAKEDGRVCKTCREWKSREHFHVDPSYSCEMHAHCKPCRREKARTLYYARTEESRAKSRAQSRKWYHNNRDSSRQVAYRYYYGITLEQYAEMLEQQGGACRVCRRACPSGDRLSVDHDHATDKVRGLLCKPCNMSLGLLGDDPDRIERLLAYLRTGGAIE